MAKKSEALSFNNPYAGLDSASSSDAEEVDTTITTTGTGIHTTGTGIHTSGTGIHTTGTGIHTTGTGFTTTHTKPKPKSQNAPVPLATNASRGNNYRPRQQQTETGDHNDSTPQESEYYSYDSYDKRQAAYRGGGSRGARGGTRGGSRFSPETGDRGGGPRAFDRHVSGTNRGRGMKKGGHGAHNWGPNDNIDYGAEISEEDRERSQAVMWGGEASKTHIDEGDNSFCPNGIDTAQGEDKPHCDDQAKNNEEDKIEETTKEQEEAEAISYEEYLKQQAARRANLPILKAKSSTTGAAEKELEREGYTLHVKEAVLDTKRAGTSPDISDRPIRSREAVNRKFEADFGVGLDYGRSGGRGRGGRGGRGGAAGAGGAVGGGRGKEEFKPDLSKINLHLEDESAFPSMHEMY